MHGRESNAKVNSSEVARTMAEEANEGKFQPKLRLLRRNPWLYISTFSLYPDVS